jgi:putative FmdB family regulatory protein
VPTYDYRCDRCERTFEVRQRISEAPLTTCDRCGEPIRRLLAAAPFILKGGGWYVTDYPSEGRKKGMDAEKSASTSASPSTSSSTSSTTSSTTTPSSNSSSSSSSSGDGAAPKPASTSSS